VHATARFSYRAVPFRSAFAAAHAIERLHRAAILSPPGDPLEGIFLKELFWRSLCVLPLNDSPDGREP